MSPSLARWLCSQPAGVSTQGGQRSKVTGSSKGYKDPPVPRRLVVESPVSGNLPTTHQDPFGPLPRLGLAGKHEEVGIGSQTNLQFRRLPVRLADRSGSADPGPVDCNSKENRIPQKPEQLYSQTIHVSNRTSHGDRKASLARSPSYETGPVALKEALESTGDSRQSHSTSEGSSSTSGLVVGREQCATGPAVTSPPARSSDIY